MTNYFVPTNFAIVEDGIFRSGQPIHINFPFLEQLKLKTVLFVSPEEPAGPFMDFILDHGIALIRVEHETALPGMSLSEDSVVAALKALLEPAHYPIMVVCNLGRHHTGTVIGCMRKLQRWNLTSIFEEYQRYAAGKVRLLNEQFIEFFDTDLVPIPATPPSWL